MAIQSDSFQILSNCRALFLRHLGALLQDSRLVSGNAIRAIQEGEQMQREAEQMQREAEQQQQQQQQ